MIDCSDTIEISVIRWCWIILLCLTVRVVLLKQCSKIDSNDIAEMPLQVQLWQCCSNILEVWLQWGSSNNLQVWFAMMLLNDSQSLMQQCCSNIRSSISTKLLKHTQGLMALMSLERFPKFDAMMLLICLQLDSNAVNRTFFEVQLRWGCVNGLQVWLQSCRLNDLQAWLQQCRSTKLKVWFWCQSL